MRISWNWLSELVDLSELKDPTALAELLTQRGLEVEAIEHQDQGFEKVVTAQILERNPHPQSDRLSLCQVSLGTSESLEIVCGAQNMKVGDKVALAQIGADLPNGVKIGQSKIRGVVSNGMLCSEEELGLKESSEGILILPSDTPLGQPLAKVLGRDDVIFSLKLTANRGDCLSHWGIAREISAALGKPLKNLPTQTLNFSNCPVSVELPAGELAPQFYGCWIQGVKIGPSPQWMVKRLEALGSRSINSVVDATNWILLELGHPTHAYDGECIVGKKIQVRLSQEGEILPLLDQTTITLTGKELVIADSDRAIGLAGVMGGGNSEVQNETQNLFLECAEFSPTYVRKAASKYQRKTEASHRFERGIDPERLEFVLGRLAYLITQLAGGKMGGSIQVKQASRSQPSRKEIKFNTHFIHDYLGLARDQAPLSLAQMQEVIKAHGCEVEHEGGEWRICPPSYRLDLTTAVDFTEEVARSIGYDKIPSTLPQLSSSPVFSGSSWARDRVMDRAKQSLVTSGLNEALNFSFTSNAWLSQFQMKSLVKILNPLSEEHEYLVPSLIPGLIKNALDNWNHHFGSEPLAIRLFELRPVFSAENLIEARNSFETGVQEEWKLACILSGPRYLDALREDQAEIDFYDVKGIMDRLWMDLGTRGIRIQPMTASRSGGNPLFHPGQSVEVLAGTSVAGHFGLLHPALAKRIKARAQLWVAELDWKLISQFSRKATEVAHFRPWSQFPLIERDFAIVVKSDVSIEKICQLALRAGKPLAQSAKVFDIYRGSQIAEGMTSIAVRVIFNDISRSLQESEAESASARILELWKKELGAELRG